MQTSSSADRAVGSEIRRHRRAAGLTQQQIAARIGVTGAQFHRYETGATRITMSRLVAIADTLNVSPNALLTTAAPIAAEPSMAPANASQEVVDLVQMFGSILDPRHRSALVAVARMISAHQQVPAEAVAGVV